MKSTARTIEIVVSLDGKTTVQTKGFSGNSCRHASKALEQALGLVEREQLTAEYHQNTINQRQDTSTQ